MNIKKLVVSTLSLTALLSAVPAFSLPAQWIPEYMARVLFVKDESVTNLAIPEPFNRAAIALLNNVLKKSAVRLKVEYVGFENAIGSFSNINAASQSPQIQAWRTKYDADFVFIWSNSAIKTHLCGYAKVQNEIRPTVAIGSTRPSCLYTQTFAHEIGHLLGLLHIKQDILNLQAKGKQKDKPLYAAGWGRPNFVTMMAYPGVHGGNTRLNIYSNPALQLCLDENCGNRDDAYSAKYINDNLEKNFAHRRIKYPYLTLFNTESLEAPEAQTLELRENVDLNWYNWAYTAKNYYIPTGWQVQFFTGKDFVPFNPPLNKHSLDIGSPEMMQFTRQMQSVKIIKRTSDKGFFIFKNTDIDGQYERLEITSSMPSLGKFNNAMTYYSLPSGWKVRFFDEENYMGDSWTRTSAEVYGENFEDRIESIEVLTQPGE